MDVEIKIAPEYKIPKAVIMTDRITDEVNTAVSKNASDDLRFLRQRSKDNRTG